jgi:phage baseplate assembly protein W
MRPQDPAFLGRGWSFPPTIAADGSTVMTSGAEDIHQSLMILMSTAMGERVMVPGFGCALTPMLFEPVSISYLTKLRDVVQTAVLDWEPRITVEAVAAVADRDVAGLIHLTVSYLIRTTNTRSNFVFPFYVDEATIAPPAP